MITHHLQWSLSRKLQVSKFSGGGDTFEKLLTRLSGRKEIQIWWWCKANYLVQTEVGTDGSNHPMTGFNVGTEDGETAAS